MDMASTLPVSRLDAFFVSFRCHPEEAQPTKDLSAEALYCVLLHVQRCAGGEILR